MRPLPPCITLIGMPTSGKSTLGSHLAQETGLRFADSDRLFEEAAGMTIADYVSNNGWSSFRAEEEDVIWNAIEPGLVLALGGGAIDSEATRARLKIGTHVVWIRAQLDTIMKRWLSQAKKIERPQLTNLPIEQETREKYERRNPLYEETAELIVEAESAIENQIQQIRLAFNI